MNKFRALSESALGLPRLVKRAAMLSVDISLAVLCVWFAYYLRLGVFVNLFSYSNAIFAVYAAIVFSIPIFMFFGMYRQIFRHIGASVFWIILKAFVVYLLLYASLVTVFGIKDVPRAVGVLQPMVFFLAVLLIRLGISVWLSDEYKSILRSQKLEHVVIYGAGFLGREMAGVLIKNSRMHLVGFVDADTNLHGSYICGSKVYAPGELTYLVIEENVSKVLLALPDVDRFSRNKILQKLKDLKVEVLTLPNIFSLEHTKIDVSLIKDLDEDDLLGREPVNHDDELINKNIFDKTVMVTGAGGSIGSQLCAEILSHHPKRLLLVDHSEFNLYCIHQKLIKQSIEIHIVPCLMSILDLDGIEEVLSKWPIDTIYHAAAYKHVPIVEENLIAGVKNNVLGTFGLVNLAIKKRVPNFILISTDKAVRPTNVMGATKRLSEMILQALQKEQITTKLSMVRFGNVLGSSGSVVPKFRDQINSGGPVTLTHPDVTRYFMTVHEAALLVLQAGCMAEGGDIFLLDMGEPVRIIDLARRMIELSGYSIKDELNPEGEIEILITGLRSGEKLYEELLISGVFSSTKHRKIKKAIDDFIPWTELHQKIKRLEIAINNRDDNEILNSLLNAVPDFIPSNHIRKIV